MKGIPNKELTKRLKENDAKAFNVLYWNYHSAIYYNVLKLIRDSIIAEDIVQEVFITLWEKRHMLDSEQEISGWLFVVSYNKSVSYLKRKLKETLGQTNLPELLEDTIDETIDIRNEIEGARIGILKNAIEHLSPQKRKVFELCKLQRKTYVEASEELNLSKHTVKEYLSEAILDIKDYIKVHME